MHEHRGNKLVREARWQQTGNLHACSTPQHAAAAKNMSMSCAVYSNYAGFCTASMSAIRGFGRKTGACMQKANTEPIFNYNAIAAWSMLVVFANPLEHSGNVWFKAASSSRRLRTCVSKPLGVSHGLGTSRHRKPHYGFNKQP